MTALRAVLVTLLLGAAGPPGGIPAALTAGGGDEEEAAPVEAPAADLADAVTVDEGVFAALRDGRDIVLRVQSDAGDDLASIARRFCGDTDRVDVLQQANSSAAQGSVATITIPWALVRAEYRYVALRALFPSDRFADRAYEHRSSDGRLPAHSEGLWQVALWFTGKGENWRELARVNGLEGPLLPPGGRAVRVPEDLLLPLFKPIHDGPDGLRYGEDAQGPFAEHAIARGEALYSAVVGRFTDLTRPDDVNSAADVIRRRSGIADVRRIEVGQVVRIPLELLATRYLPANEPRRVLATLHEAEIAGLAPPTPAAALEGVHVLLDPGHGGDDIGARHGRVWESDYVYDIACRVERRLEQDTAATVHLLVRDPQHGCRVLDRRRLPRSRREVVATEPSHSIRRGATQVAVNLRWYLANAIFRDLTGQHGVAPDKTVFISLHADSLHQALRGAMVYIPGERYRRGVLGDRGPAYALYREWRAAPQVTISRPDRLRDEAASRRLASALLFGLQEQALPIHDDQPVRDHIIRRAGARRAWVPAVLRGNLVPAKVLVETVNLGNEQDARLLEDPQGRERIAAGVVAGLLRFYSDGSRPAAREPRSVRR